jgi:hypothetical protein
MSLTAMRKVFLGIIVTACALELAWQGWLLYISKDARKFDSAKVFVTLHGVPAQCEIRMGLYGAQRALPCGDVPSYVRDDLKLPVGVTFGISDFGNTHSAEIASLNSALKTAGYRSVGSIKSFITEPEPPAGNR